MASELLSGLACCPQAALAIQEEDKQTSEKQQDLLRSKHPCHGEFPARMLARSFPTGDARVAAGRAGCGKNFMMSSSPFHRFPFSRRQFLAGLGGVLGWSALSSFARGSASTEFFFLGGPAASSGIDWVHDAGKSAKKYLPESEGPGCGFLDYDNDGWMDIYLVNSGPVRFLYAHKTIAQCSVSQQPRRHVYRCRRESRRGRRRLRHGGCGWRLRRRRLP